MFKVIILQLRTFVASFKKKKISEGMPPADFAQTLPCVLQRHREVLPTMLKEQQESAVGVNTQSDITHASVLKYQR